MRLHLIRQNAVVSKSGQAVWLDRVKALITSIGFGLFILIGFLIVVGQSPVLAVSNESAFTSSDISSSVSVASSKLNVPSHIPLQQSSLRDKSSSALMGTAIPTVIDDVVITQDISWDDTSLTFNSLIITNSATLTLIGSTTITANQIIIAPGSAISADEQGYPKGQLYGGGNTPWLHGGHHGGRGGYNPLSPYGNVYAPINWGSGGDGGAGGGAIHLIVSDTLVISGTLSANGAYGAPAGYSGRGGGAGGSIWIEVAGTLTGNGTISAMGGSGSSDYTHQGGAGGGGRIAIYTPNNQFLSNNGTINVSPGGPYNHQTASGEPGTVYLDSVDPGTSTVVATPTTLIADGQSTGTVTVTLLDSNGIPVPDRVVELNVSPWGNVTLNNQPITNGYTVIGTTNISGIVTTTIAATQIGERLISAQTIEGEIVNQSVTITFNAGTVDSPNSDVSSVGSTIAAANGVDVITVKVTARDQQGNPVSGAATTLNTEPEITVTPINSFTNGQGEAIYELRHDTPAVVVVSGTINGVSIPSTVTATFRGADLVSEKEGPAQITAGYPISYHITVANQGLLTATNVVVTDTLPVSTLFVTTTGSYAGVYDSANHTVVWSIGTMPANTQTVFQVRVQVPATATISSIITNTVTGTLSEIELNTTNNQDSVVTTILAAFPQMVITPPTLDLSVLAGDSASTVITVTNNGTGALEDLTVLPTSYSWLSVQPTMLSSLGVGQSFTFTVQAATTSTLPLGHYLDELQFAAANHTTVTVNLDAYVHPLLADLSVQVTNSVNNAVTGATISFEKSNNSVRYVNGVFSGYEAIVYNATTDSNGTATLEQIEVGEYTYQVSASGHLPVTRTLAVNQTPPQLEVNLQAMPTLVFEPSQANLSVLAGEPTYYMFQVRNTGPGHAENFGIQTPSELPWLSSGLPYSVTQLEAGEAMSITLFLTPPASNEPVIYAGYQVVVSANFVENAVLNLTIHSVPTATGTIDFQITDLIDNELLIEGATITLINQTGRSVTTPEGTYTIYDWYTATADISGTARLSNLAPDEYTYYVEANSYYAAVGTANVSPGEPSASLNINRESVGLAFNPFQYTWDVEETTITDIYAMTLEVTFQSDVSRPALFISPELICPPGNGGSDSEDWLIANMGSFTITNMVVTVDYPDFTFVINGGNNGINSLAPGASINLPFMASSPDPANQPYRGTVYISGSYASGGANYTYQTSAPIQRCGYGSGGGIPGHSNWDWQINPGTQNPTATSTGPSTNVPPLPEAAPPPPIPGPNGEVAQLILSGSASLERQAFNARLVLNKAAGLITNIRVFIHVFDENGEAISDGFAITPTLPTTLGNLSPSQTLIGQWLIVPGDLGITNTNGAPYYVGAQIFYTYNGSTHSFITSLSQKVIYPQPRVRLDFSHNQPDENGTFYIEVVAKNDGYGIARNLTLNLSQVTALPDLDGNGRSLLFGLKETTVNNNTQTTEYVFRFGDILPGQIITGRWSIAVSTSDGTALINPVITGFRVECEHRDYQGLQLTPLIVDCGEIPQYDLTYDCPFLGYDERNLPVGGPINTANGNYTYGQSTPSMGTGCDALRATWTYNSLNSGAFPALPATSSPLGVGWSFNYDLHLEVSGANKINGIVEFQAPHGNTLHFEEVRDSYRAASGTYGSLNRAEVTPGQYVYTLTTRTQATYVFNNDGRITRYTDPQGNILLYTHNTEGQLEQVTDPITGRYLAFSYMGTGNLAAVTDPLNQVTQFGYDILGLLTTITDTRGFVWQYAYTQLNSGQYILSHVIDPEGRTVEQTGFDSFGRAITQTYRGQELSIVYYEDGRRLITNGLGEQMLLVYNNQNLLVARTVATSSGWKPVERFVLDSNLNRISNEDPSGYLTAYDKTAFGYITIMTDTMGYVTRIDYDARNNWSQMTNGRGQTTYYAYDENSHLITETNHLNDTILYTYNELGLVESVTNENGHTTWYGYDAIGQLVVITNALNLTIYYEYDAVGRLITTTNTTGQIVVQQYDAANHVIQVTVNSLAGQPQNYLNQYNLITRYAYDGAGYPTIVTDTLGRMNLSLYDSAGRVVTQVVNYDGVTPRNELCLDFNNPDPEYNICALTTYDGAGRVIATTDSLGRLNRTFYDEQGQVRATIDNWSGTITDVANVVDCLALPGERDEDICTLYGYDVAGNNTVMTDTLGRMMRTFLDPLGRVEGMIMNWNGQTTLTDCDNLPAERDYDICLRFAYDEVGNTMIMTDTLGRMSRTFYNDLGRTEASVANWNPATLTSPAECLLSPDNSSDENICTLYVYDAVGNQIVITNALGQQSLTVYDALNRPFITVANWDGTPITSADDCAFPPAQADTNLCTITYFDAFGRPYTTKDALGNLTTIGYNSQGRPVTVTKYLDGIPATTVIGYDAAGRRIEQTDAENHTTRYVYDSLNRVVTTISPAGVAITQTYDAAGRVVSTTNNLNQVIVMTYDDLDRLISIKDAEQNSISYIYDVSGNQIAVIDANGIRTSYDYDDLNRPIRVIENDTAGTTATNSSDIVTEYRYDALGQIVSIVNGRGITVTRTAYDDLNRSAVITDALGHEQHYQYNALGLPVVVTDTNGAVTLYSYDGLNRPVTINYVADGEVVRYTYNALGHRLVMTDSLGVTQYTYDTLYRLTGVTDSFYQAVGYEYDRVGNLTQLTYPGGRVVTYLYNTDNRLVQVEDGPTRITAYEYDSFGRLVTTTLPNGVVAVNQYDDANHLINLRYTASDDSLLANYHYVVDELGNRLTVTETVLAPEYVNAVEAFLEENGLLVLEAENGQSTPGAAGHEWVQQAYQSDYAGTSYIRAVPDVGSIYQPEEITSSARQEYKIAITNPATYAVWVRGMAANASGDSLYVGIDGQVADGALTGFTNEWGWSNLTMDNLAQTVTFGSTGIYSFDLWMREDGLRVDRVLLSDDPNYVPTGEGPQATEWQAVPSIVPSQIITQVIYYEYDGLYRLQSAVYSGTITATYLYAYDAVGNMTAYTETVGVDTVRVQRYFDDANRLQASFDLAVGTTSYLYDNNGNLVEILPPGTSPEGRQRFIYNQRNLLITNTLYVTEIGDTPLVDYHYDGAGNRLQQVDYSQTTPVMTSYTNNIVGLSQVLIADDGTNQVVNVFGLDLISQDEGTSQRFLLTDGLGSVRQEMVADDLVTLTMYDPYGNQLVQTGTTGTTYGFTGEQQDSANGLLYLRARYYNPALRSFMGKDPWSGNNLRPQSRNGWSYVENNPINLTDPTGFFPDYCKAANDKVAYIDCVIQYYRMATYSVNQPGPFLPYEVDRDNYLVSPYIPTEELEKIIGTAGCFSGPVPYRGEGYLEGVGGATLLFMGGIEVVYDFAAMQRQEFYYYGGGWGDAVAGLNASEYAGYINGFRSWTDIELDYGGPFTSVSVSAGPDLGIFGLTFGVTGFIGSYDPTIQGVAWSINASISSVPGIGFQVGVYLYYRPFAGEIKSYIRDQNVLEGELIFDILRGAGSPVDRESLTVPSRVLFGIPLALKYAWIYEDMRTN